MLQRVKVKRDNCANKHTYKHLYRNKSCKYPVEYQQVKHGLYTLQGGNRFMSVCCMLLPHNDYRVHQHFKRHVCELSCSSKHRFLKILPIFEHWFETNRYSTPLKTCRAKLVYTFISQCCYFNSQRTVCRR